MYSIPKYNGIGNEITPEGVEEVMGVVGSSYSTTSLDIGGLIEPTLCFSVCSCYYPSIHLSALTHISYPGNHTRSEGVAACARMLSTNPLICHLDIDGLYVCCLFFCFFVILLFVCLLLPTLEINSIVQVAGYRGCCTHNESIDNGGRKHCFRSFINL